jgi:hypothetical protein
VSRTNVVIPVRVSESTETVLRTEADAAGLPMGTYIRAVLDSHAQMHACPTCHGAGVVAAGRPEVIQSPAWDQLTEAQRRRWLEINSGWPTGGSDE